MNYFRAQVDIAQALAQRFYNSKGFTAQALDSGIVVTGLGLRV